MSSIKREIRHFYAVVVQKWAKKCTKKRAKWLFCFWNLLCFFLTFSLPPASLDLKVPILAGKRDSRHYSTTCFMKNVLVEESSYQMLEVSTFCDREGTQTPSIKITAVTFLWKKKYNKDFPSVYFLRRRT